MAMDLDDREAQAFWPLYREYRVEMAKVGDRPIKRVTTYVDSYPGTSGALADQIPLVR